MKGSARSSFFWPMQLLPARKRQALRMIYQFCREMDDIADGTLPQNEKIMQLEAWKSRLHQPEQLPEILAAIFKDFAIPRLLPEALIDGMVMDVRGQMCWPDEAALDLYCYRVAGTVGLMALPIFGCTGEPAEQFARHLGQALQRLNMARDIEEDKVQGRIYVPDMFQHQDWNVSTFRHYFASSADTHFQDSLAALPAPLPLRLLPALLMAVIYRRRYRRDWSKGLRHNSQKREMIVALYHASLTALRGRWSDGSLL